MLGTQELSISLSKMKLKSANDEQQTLNRGKSCEKGKDQMKAIGYDVCDMLENGSPLDEAKEEAERRMHQ